MIRQIDHIGIAVKELDSALSFFTRVMGGKNVHKEEVPEQKVRVASLPAGESTIELLEPTSAEGPVARFIEFRGEGIHHLALEVEDLEKALKDLKAQGVRLIDEKPRKGAGGKKIAFVHPGGAHGVLIELCQPADGK